MNDLKETKQITKCCICNQDIAGYHGTWIEPGTMEPGKRTKESLKFSKPINSQNSKLGFDAQPEYNGICCEHCDTYLVVPHRQLMNIMASNDLSADEKNALTRPFFTRNFVSY